MSKENPKPFSNIRAVFFDTGDTLYSSQEMEAAYPKKLVELLSSTSNISENEARTLLKETTQRLKETEKHVTKVRAMAELGFSRAEVHEAFCKVNPGEFLSEDQELDLIISKLSKKYKLGIISNFKRSHVLEILDALGLSSKWFPVLVTEDIVEEIKPSHEPFIKAAELAGCKPSECLYIGDSPTKDMRPAKEAGMMTVLIGGNIPEEHASYIDEVIPDVKKAANFLPI